MQRASQSRRRVVAIGGEPSRQRDKMKLGAQDRMRTNMNEDYGVQEMTKSFRVRRERLQEAVGDGIDDERRNLSK